MPSSKNAAQYRIGDFARFLGVTPDFLKHYEEKGLLEAQHRNSGYRFFGFQETYKVVEFMRLRNYGASVRDMGRMLCTNAEDALRALDDKAAGIEKEIERQQALLEEHRLIKAWLAERRGRTSDWEVREAENFWFLPHSNGQAFLKDPRIYEIIQTWFAWMPLVKSSMLVSVSDEPSSLYKCQWGLCIMEAHAKRFGLPANEAVQFVKGGRAFVWNFADFGPNDQINRIAMGDHPLFEQMRVLGLRAAGPMISKLEMKLKPSEDCKWSCGSVIVPLRE